MVRINKEEAVGLIIDFQEKLIPHVSNNIEVVERTIILINGLLALGIPVAASKHYSKGVGDIPEQIKSVLPKDCTFEKISFSWCDEPIFYQSVLPKDKKFVIIAGIESHVCVLQTTIDLLEAGYIPVIVEDCVSSRKEKDKSIALQRMLHSGAIVTTSESILFELCRYAGNDDFKAIFKLVK